VFFFVFLLEFEFFMADLPKIAETDPVKEFPVEIYYDMNNNNFLLIAIYDIMVNTACNTVRGTQIRAENNEYDRIQYEKLF